MDKNTALFSWEFVEDLNGVASYVDGPRKLPKKAIYEPIDDPDIGFPHEQIGSFGYHPQNGRDLYQAFEDGVIDTVENGKFVYWNGKCYVANEIYYDQGYPADIAQAWKYWDAVEELDRTEAGKKARYLVADLLNEKQRDMWLRYGYFYHRVWERCDALDEAWSVLGDKELIKIVLEITALTGKKGEKRIEFAYPFMPQPDNPVLVFKFQMWPHLQTSILHKEKGEVKRQTFCYHPEKPYPSGDIVAAQYLMVSNDAKEFLRKANW